MSEQVANVEQTAPVSDPQTGSKKKKMALWKKILIGVVVFFVAIITVAFMSTRGIADAADQYMTDLRAGNCTAMYADATSEFKDVTTAEQWDEACQRISAILQGEPEQKGVEVKSNSGSDQIGEAEYSVEGTDGITYIVMLQLVNRDDMWQFNALDSTAQ